MELRSKTTLPISIAVCLAAATFPPIHAVHAQVTPTNCVSPPPNLVSWWRAERDTKDSAGTNNGVAGGSLVYGPGEVARGFVFDGITSYVSVPASASLDVGQSSGLTIEAWINPLDLAPRPLFDWDANSAWAVHVWCSTPTPGCLYANLVDTTATHHIIQTAGGLLATNAFSHIALTYDKVTGLARLFVNGAVALESNLGTFSPQTGYNLNIGYRLPGAPFGFAYFAGAIDEASVYNLALSTNEIQSIYNAGTFGKCASPIAPFFITQPASQTVTVSNTATFTVQVSGSMPLSYQWAFNGTNLNGATTSSLALAPVQFSHTGNYAVQVTNAAGSITSTDAVLTVTTTPPCFNPPTNLVSWWRAESSAADQVAANNGMLVGNATFGSGRVGSGFVLDGSGDGVLIGNPANLQLQNFTIEAWIQRASATAASLSSGGGFIFGYGPGGYGFGMNDGGNLFFGKVAVDSVTASTSLADTNLHHVAVT